MVYGVKEFLFALLLSLAFQPLVAQFAPAAGLPGSTAIPGDSSAFVEWASGCTVQRGLMNIADTSLGYASAGDESCALGPAGQNGTLSLGDGGIATVTFTNSIFNGEGFDFAVFENGFMTNGPNMAFLELGFVEVSSDGINFFRFPSICNVEDTAQTAPFGSTDGSQLYDLAGKYIYDYGTPFDLEELKDSVGLDVNNVTHVRIIDVVGSIDPRYATHDSRGHIVNDPWPTPYATCGFDLDAVGVIHANGLAAIEQERRQPLKIFPNPAPAGTDVKVQLMEGMNSVLIYDINGKLLDELHPEVPAGLFSLNTAAYAGGVYLLCAKSSVSCLNAKLVIE
jgi:hypothetical protein